MERNQEWRSDQVGHALGVSLPLWLVLCFTLISTSADGRKIAQSVERTPSSIDSKPTLGQYPEASFSLSADGAVAPDIAPSGVTRIRVSTSTSFQGTIEADPSTGVVRVTNAHPAGLYVVSVKAFDNAGASAEKTFSLTVRTSAACAPFYFAASTRAVGGAPQAVAVGDFNHDGKQDVVVANGMSSTASILLGDGLGGFLSRADFAIGYACSSLAVDDFNGDGKQDLVGSNFYDGTVSVLLGDGAGGFSSAATFAAGHYCSAVAVGDFNRDGKQDLAVSNNDTNNLSVLLGDGLGSFGPPTNFDAGYALADLAVGDFNNDGKQDVVITRQLSDEVVVLLGNGAGGFGAPTRFATGDYPRAVAVGDFNADGKQDLAVEYYSIGVSILLGDGTGRFSAPTNFPLGPGVGTDSIAVGDFNADGTQDIVAIGGAFDSVAVLLGHGTGGFGKPIVFAAGKRPSAIAVGDFDRDGMQDLAIANSESDEVSIMLRVCLPTPTSVASRKMHTFNRGFDLPLPLSGSVGIECRNGGATGDYAMVVTFSSSVDVMGDPQAEVISGTATVGSGGTASGGAVNVSGTTVTIPLTGVADAQRLEVRLNAVDSLTDVVIPMAILVGDTTASGMVNASDVTHIKSQVGQPVTESNFRADINANGSISASDVSLGKTRSGGSLPRPN